MSVLSRVALSILLLMAGCQRGPDSYPPPAQRPPLDTTEPNPVMGRFVMMSDPNADEYVVRDISRATESGAWRWTSRRPELRFYLESTENLRFTMDFVLAKATFRETGPVTLAISINGRPFDKVRCIKPDQLHYEKPVSQAFLKEYGLNSVVIEPDKVYIAKEDGAALGFILTGAGFVR